MGNGRDGWKTWSHESSPWWTWIGRGLGRWCVVRNCEGRNSHHGGGDSGEFDVDEHVVLQTLDGSIDVVELLLKSLNVAHSSCGGMGDTTDVASDDKGMVVSSREVGIGQDKSGVVLCHRKERVVRRVQLGVAEMSTATFGARHDG